MAGFLESAGLGSEIREFGESTRNSGLAAEALGCTIAEIAKSVVFVGPSTSVVVISGDKKVDQSKLGSVVGGPVRVATPGEVRGRTGYPVGGVPPFPHGEGVRVLPDASLLRFESVWAAAGAPNAVFRVRSRELVRLVGEEPLVLSL